MEMWTGYIKFKLIHIIIKLGIIDLLNKNKMSCNELAEKSGTKPELLRKVLKVLCLSKVLNEPEKDVFEIGENGKDIISQKQKDLLSYIWEDWWMKSWSNLGECLKTGEVPFEKSFGEDFYSYISKNSDAKRMFNSLMSLYSSIAIDSILNKYDFSGFKKIVDIGGGEGNIISRILEKNEDVRGVIFDLPHMLEDSKSYLESKGLSERCDVVSGDVFEPFKIIGDLYILKNVVHMCNDEKALKILRNCRETMDVDSKLLIIEHILEDNSPSNVFNIIMYTLVNGKERTLENFINLSNDSGFKFIRNIEVINGLNIIELQPI